MLIEIISEIPEPLLDRVSINYRASFNGAIPSRQEIIQTLSLQEGNYSLGRFISTFGKSEIQFTVRRYNTPGTLRKLELPKHIVYPV